eukprot:2035685-Pleurochrysis_carterae.AAC.5
MDLHQQAAGCADWLYDYDDKCGSSFFYLPAPRGGRYTASSASECATPLLIYLVSPRVLSFSLLSATIHTKVQACGVWHFTLSCWFRSVLEIPVGDAGELSSGRTHAPQPCTTEFEGWHTFWADSLCGSPSPLQVAGQAGKTVVHQPIVVATATRETHALHWALVHYGVVQKIISIRHLPKHSHNLSDRVHSMVGEKIQPKGGVYLVMAVRLHGIWRTL